MDNMDDMDYIFESLGMGPVEKENINISGDCITFNNIFMEEEEEEELRVRKEKALEEFKKRFEGEITEELKEQITNRIVQQLKEEQEKVAIKLEEERQKLEEEKERLREEELQRVFKESLDLEDEISKSNLEIVDNEPDISKKRQNKFKKQPIQEEIISTNGTTQIYVGQRDGVEIQRRKVSLLKRFGVVLKDFLLIVLSLEFVLFIGIILTNLVNPSLELDIVETFIEVNITAFKIIVGVLQDVWVYLKEKYLQK